MARSVDALSKELARAKGDVAVDKAARAVMERLREVHAELAELAPLVRDATRALKKIEDKLGAEAELSSRQGEPAGHAHAERSSVLAEIPGTVDAAVVELSEALDSFFA